MNGIIYILSHEAIPNLLKIGYTTRTIEERVQELSSTGVPGNFTVELYFKTDNAPMFEMILHKSLDEYRYEKEFFKVDIKTAIHAIHNLIDKDELRSYRFLGKSSTLATTREQLAEQKKQADEKRERLEQRSREFKEKYLDKSLGDLRVALMVLNKSELSFQNQQESKQIHKLILMKQQQEREESQRKWMESDRYKQIQRNLLVYEKEHKTRYAELGRKVDELISEISPKQNFINSFTVFSMSGGKKIAKNLSLEQRQLIAEFYALAIEVHSLTDSYNLGHAGIFSYRGSLINEQNMDGFTDYFKGIASGCNASK
jgi:hypothetical protein